MGHRQSRPDGEQEESAGTAAHAAGATDLVSHAITLDTMSTTSTIYSFAAPLGRASVQSLVGRPSVEVASRTPRPSMTREGPDSVSATPSRQPDAASPEHPAPAAVTPLAVSEEEQVTPIALASATDLEAVDSQAAAEHQTAPEALPTLPTEEPQVAVAPPSAAYTAEAEGSEEAEAKAEVEGAEAEGAAAELVAEPEVAALADERSAHSFVFDAPHEVSAVTLAPTLSVAQAVPAAETAQEPQQDMQEDTAEELQQEVQEKEEVEEALDAPSAAPEQTMPQAPTPTPTHAASEAPKDAPEAAPAPVAAPVATPAPALVSAFAPASTIAPAPAAAYFGVPPIPEDSTSLALMAPEDEGSASPVTPQGMVPQGSLAPGQMGDSPQLSMQESDSNSFRSTPVYVDVKLVKVVEGKMAKAVSLELVPRKDSDHMPLAVKLVPLNTPVTGFVLGSATPVATQKVHPAKDLVSSPSLDTAIERAVLPLVQASANTPTKLHASASLPAARSPEATAAAESAEKSVPRSFSMRNASGKTLTRQISKRMSTLTRSVSMRVQSALCVKPTPVK